MEIDRWEHFEHQADIGVHGVGNTMAGSFEQAALALTAVVTDPGAIDPIERVEVDCEATDREMLLVDWLNALIYEMSLRKMLFRDFKVTIDDGHLHAVMRGEKIDVSKHHPAVEIKGATYTALEVGEDAHHRWHARCVVDV